MDHPARPASAQVLRWISAGLLGTALAGVGAVGALAAGPHPGIVPDDGRAPDPSTPTPEDEPPQVYRAFAPGAIAAGPELNVATSTLLSLHAGARFTSPLAAWTGITDRFGAARGEGGHHTGIDFGLAGHPGSPILAACPGVVVATGWSGGYGNRVVLDCGDGWETLYAHLSLIAVLPGMFVARGSVLGISGSTGYSTGEHLHFEIRHNGLPVDPELYIDFGSQPGVAVLGPLPGDATSGDSLASPPPRPAPIPLAPSAEPAASTPQPASTPVPTATAPAEPTLPEPSPAESTPTPLPAEPTPTPGSPTPLSTPEGSPESSATPTAAAPSPTAAPTLEPSPAEPVPPSPVADTPDASSPTTAPGSTATPWAE